MSYDTILTEISDDVLTITINRPQKKNAFNIQQYNEISSVLRDAKDNDDVLAVILTGTEGAFSAGQDLTSASPPSSEPEADTGAPAGFAGYAEILQHFDKPLLAAVNGVAVGVGVTTLFNCDIVYIAESARFRMPFTALGIVPEACSSVLLPMLVGYQKAAEIFFTSRWISADEFYELGLCAEIVSDDQVLAKARETAAVIAEQAPSSVRETKRLMLAARQDAMAQAHERELAALSRSFGTPENMEAMMAFMQKRKPDFKKARQG